MTNTHYTVYVYVYDRIGYPERERESESSHNAADPKT